jgi:hypothetical protein
LYEHRSEISDEKFNAWKVNLETIGYESGRKLGYEYYYTQPVEVDARIFAEAVTNHLSFR